MVFVLALLAACSPGGDPVEGTSGAAGEMSTAGPPDLTGFNLLLFTIDTLRADRVGAYGDAQAATPRLDELAQRGVLFENCYSPVPLTLPSHGTLLTGRYPFAHGARTNGNYLIRDEEVTLAERLREAGFHTRAQVATFILSGKFGLAQGFDVYDDSLDSGDLIRGFSSEITADVVTDRFVGWLGTHDSSRFFSWLHFYDPHQPWSPPPPFDQRFADDPYRGEVAFVDQQVGRILDALEERGLAEKTLVVITSDHGEGFGEHGEVGHGILAYEQYLRIPLIIAAGKQLAPRVVGERVRLMDLMPTLLELFELPPAETQGESFAALFAGQGEEVSRDVYFESMLGREENNWAPLTGLIRGQHKYISVPERELYDLAQDPGETNNLFGQGEVREVVRELDKALRELLLTESATEGARREASSEDLAHLEALGYISSDSAVTNQVIDPKQGIRLERQLQQVREQVAAGDLTAASAGLKELAEANEEVGVGSYYFLHHQVRAAQNDTAGAVRALEEGMARFPESDRFPFLLAHYRLQLGDAAAAEREAKAVLEKSPQFSQAIILLGRAMEQQGRLPEAIARYREARALEPRNLPLQERLAEALLRSGDGAGALAAFDALEAAGAFDERPQDLAKVAMLSLRLGRGDRAEALLRRALEVGPSGMGHLSFAMVLAQRQKLDEAIVQMETALRDYGGQLNAQQSAMARQALEQWRAAQ